MKKITLCAGTLLLTAGVFARPFSVDQVPADTKWVAHADFAKLRETKMGKAVIRQMDGKKRQKLDAFSVIFNFDLVEDIDSILIFGNSLEQNGQGVLLLSGYFDEEHLETLLMANETYETTEYNGYTIHSWIGRNKKKDPARRTYGAMSSDGTIIVGEDLKQVSQALDVLEGCRDSLEEKTALNLSGRADAAFFMAALEVPPEATLPANAQILRQARSLFLSLAEVDDNLVIELEVIADSPEAATQMESVVRGLVAMATLQSETNPELAKLVQGLKITKTNTGVSLQMDYPVEKVLEAIKKKTTEEKAASLNDAESD